MPTSEFKGDADSVLSLFFADLEHHPVPSREHQAALARRVADGDADARDEMVRCNLRLVVHWATAVSGRGVEMTDLIQEGVLGLMHAVDKFDWERGFAFSTYATWWIRQSLQRALLTKHTIRLPLEVAEKQWQISQLADEFLETLHRRPTAEEIQAHLALTATRRRVIEGAGTVVASLDQGANADSETPLADLIASTDRPETAEDDSMSGSIREAVDALPNPQRTVITLRFGFSDHDPLSITQTAAALHMSRRKVQHIESQALDMLRRSSALVAA